MLTITLSLASPSGWAQNLEPFHQRIEILRDKAGRIKSLRLRENKFLFQEYIEELNFLVVNLQKNSDFKYKSVENILQSQNISNWTSSQKLMINQTINLIKDPKLVKAMQNPKLYTVMVRIEHEMNVAFFEFNTLAMPYKPLSFYRSSFTEQFILWATDFAASQLRLNTAVNLAKYLAFRLINFGIERRTYFQNYIIHYLKKVGPEKLGMTKEEGSLILSSIYESRIEFYEFWDVLKAKADWYNFGNKYHKREISTCAERFKNYRDPQKKHYYYDFKFVEVNYAGATKVFNLLNRRSRLSGSPSIAYSASDPNQLLVERILFEVIKMALELSPAPGAATAPLNWFISGMYKNQITTEGALLAYLESIGDLERAEIMIRQSLNPFITSLYGQAKTRNERISQPLIERLSELK